MAASPPSIALAVAAALGVACGGSGDSGVDAGADAAPPAGQGSEAREVLAVNEVAPRPVDGADWIEIVNRSDQALDLCDYFVTDSLDRLDHYLPLGGALPPDPCEPRLLEPGAYLVVHADDAAVQGMDHAPFRLGLADEAHVVTWTGAPVDSFVYLYPETEEGLTLARVPDASGLFFLAEPTPGAANPGEESL
jgi:hypothetical protein